MNSKHPIGIFDSGYGGLTVFKSILNLLPQYDYIYLGDNARAPYGNHSYETVYNYTRECVNWFFKMDCPLVILACNTASAKALRTIQQTDLKSFDTSKRVLGVIRPTAEVIGNYTTTKHIGVLGTKGTIISESYIIEIKKFFPDIVVTQLSCPMWVPIIENGEHLSDGADYFVAKYLKEILKNDPQIDTLLLGCTHYPLLIDKIKKYLSSRITLITQGDIVASSLSDYLQRHTEIDKLISKNGTKRFFTTDETIDFDIHGELFFGEKLESERIFL